MRFGSVATELARDSEWESCQRQWGGERHGGDTTPALVSVHHRTPLTSFYAGTLPCAGEGEDVRVHQGPVHMPLTVEVAACSQMHVHAHSRAVNQPSGCGGQVKKQEILIILHFVKLGNNLCSIFQMVDDCVNNLARFSLCCCCCRSGGHGARRPCLNRPEGMI